MKADIKGALARPAAAPCPGPLRGLPLDCVLPPRPWVAGHHAVQEGRWGVGEGCRQLHDPQGCLGLQATHTFLLPCPRHGPRGDSSPSVPPAHCSELLEPLWQQQGKCARGSWAGGGHPSGPPCLRRAPQRAPEAEKCTLHLGSQQVAALRAEGAGPRAAPGPPQHSPGEGGASSLSRCFSTQPMVTPEGTLCPGLADSVLLWPLGPAKSQLVNSQAQFLLLTTQ